MCRGGRGVIYQDENTVAFDEAEVEDLLNRKDFILIDYQDNKFATSVIVGVLDRKESEQTVFLTPLRIFNDCLEECMKYTLGVMDGVKMFKEGVFKPTDYIQIVYTQAAKQRIKRKRYITAELIYPDLKLLRKSW